MSLSNKLLRCHIAPTKNFSANLNVKAHIIIKSTLTKTKITL